VILASFVVWQQIQTKQTSSSQEPTPVSITNTPPPAALPPVALTPTQAESLTRALTAVDAITAALSGDNIQAYNTTAPEMADKIQKLVEVFPADHPWAGLLAAVQTQSQLSPAGDLNEARLQFGPFSTAFYKFVETGRKQAKELRSVKLYRCPMAPKPGVWFQLEGPLKNPYFGAEMLDCGVEVSQ
jgi:hypothetical protein